MGMQTKAYNYHYHSFASRNGLLYRVQFTKTIAFCPGWCCRKKTEQSVHDRLSFAWKICNTRGEEKGFFALTQCFWSDHAFVLSALNKKIWFHKYFTENVLKPLLKQAYYLRVLHSKVRSVNVIHTFSKIKRVSFSILTQGAHNTFSRSL